MASNLDKVCEDVFEVFFAVESTLKKHVTSDEKTTTLGTLLPLIAESMGVDAESPDFASNDTLIRHYLHKHEEYVVCRGRHGGVRKLKTGESKKSASVSAE